jgi:hypothetical protein
VEDVVVELVVVEVSRACGSASVSEVQLETKNKTSK